MRKAAFTTFLLAVFASAAIAQESPSMVGTWTLNVAKSDFGKQPPLKSATIQLMDDKDNSLKWTYTETTADGKTSTAHYSGAFDGKPHPITGDQRMKSAAFTRKGDTAEITWTMADGTTMHETTTIKGDVMTNKAMTKDGTVTTVYERKGGASKGVAK
jgi:hypothetical protein